MQTLNAHGGEEKRMNMINDEMIADKLRDVPKEDRRKIQEGELDELATRVTKTRVFHYASEIPTDGPYHLPEMVRCFSRRLDHPPQDAVCVHVISLLVDRREIDQFEVKLDFRERRIEYLIPDAWLTPKRVAVIDTYVKKPS